MKKLRELLNTYYHAPNPDANSGGGYGKATNHKMVPRPSASGFPYDMYELPDEDEEFEFDNPNLQKRFANKIGKYSGSKPDYVSRPKDPFSYFDDATVGLTGENVTRETMDDSGLTSLEYKKLFWEKLSIHQKKYITNIKKKIDFYDRKSEEAYIDGDYDVAESYDAIYDDLSEKLDSILSELEEDFDISQDKEDWTRDSENIPSLEEEFSILYHQFLQGKKGYYSHFQSENSLAGALRDVLDGYNGTFLGASDEQIIDAAKDAYEHKIKRLKKLKKENKIREFVRSYLNESDLGESSLIRLRSRSSEPDGAVNQFGLSIPGGTQFGWSSAYPFKDRESYQPVMSLKDMMAKRERHTDRSPDLEPEEPKDWQKAIGDENYEEEQIGIYNKLLSASDTDHYNK